MPIVTKYEKILKEEGKAAADLYMKELSAKVKNRKGFKDVSAERRREIAMLGVEARKAKRGN